MRRRLTLPLAAAAIAVLGVVLMASPAGAHTRWEPETAAPGSVVELTLVAADEEDAGDTVRVEMQFPQPITVAALPEVPGWTATLVDGEVGGAATGVTWEGGPTAGDLRLPITLGPLPAEPGRLQFPTVQTYSNGVEAPWIQDWPQGAPEPDNPSPVLDVVPGGPGSIPPSTTTTAAPTTTTTEAPTTTAEDEGEDAAPPAQEEDDSDDGGGSALPIIIVVLVVLALAGGAYLGARSRRGGEEGTSSPTDTQPPSDDDQ